MPPVRQGRPRGLQIDDRQTGFIKRQGRWRTERNEQASREAGVGGAVVRHVHRVGAENAIVPGEIHLGLRRLGERRGREEERRGGNGKGDLHGTSTWRAVVRSYSA